MISCTAGVPVDLGVKQWKINGIGEVLRGDGGLGSNIGHSKCYSLECSLLHKGCWLGPLEMDDSKVYEIALFMQLETKVTSHRLSSLRCSSVSRHFY